MKIVTGNEFKQETENGLVLVDFYADWCGPCKMISPVLEQLSTKYASNIKIIKVNVDNDKEIAMNYGVQSIPNLCLLKNGELIDRMIGFSSAPALEAFVTKNF